MSASTPSPQTGQRSPASRIASTVPKGTRAGTAETNGYHRRMLRGAIAAAVTPLRDDGSTVDEDAFAPFVRFLSVGGVDGVLACGTTGEGILLSVDERK